MFRSGHDRPTRDPARRRRPSGYTTHRLRSSGFRRPLRVWLDPSHGPWLPELEHITGMGPDHRDGLHGKVPAITAWAGTRRIAWLDDDFQRRDPEWAAQRGDTLLVPVDPRKGIGAAHLERVLTFLTSG